MNTPWARPQPILPALALAVACAWGAAQFWPLAQSEQAWLPLALAGLAGFLAFRVAGTSVERALNLARRIEASQPSDKAGTAHWASRGLLRRRGLFRPKGLFLGKAFGRGVFLDGETHGLTLSPAGGGKTQSFVLPALAHSDLSMVVTDFKGVLSVQTAAMRRKHLGHETACFNPAGLFADQLGPSAEYNPMQILSDDWESPAHRSDLVADAQGIARHLHPEPPTAGENQYFRNGSRRLIVFVLLYLVVIAGPHRANLCEALRMLRVREELIEALKLAAHSPALNGELADMARDLLPKFESQDTRQAETFREGAVQALDVFAPSGRLAACITRCSFRFHELKTRKLTIYLVADPTRMKVFAKAFGLLIWCALTELKRCQSSKPALLLCEEATNFVVESLPSSLTELREFGVRVWFVIQELEEFAKAYGRPALETLLSQTEVKQIFGVASPRTAELVSRMLGDTTARSASHNLGRGLADMLQTSLGDAPRRLMTPDEVRRSREVILFIRDLPPIAAEQVGVHEVEPWRSRVAPSPLHAKPLRGRTRLRVRAARERAR